MIEHPAPSILTIPLQQVYVASDAPPAVETPAPQIVPLPDGPLLVWEMEPECYIAFGAAGYVRARWQMPDVAKQTVRVVVLTGDTFDEAREKIPRVPDAVLASALVLMDGGVWDVAQQVGLSKSHVSRLASSWRNAIPALRQLWLDGMPSRRVFELARRATTAQTIALAGITDPDAELNVQFGDRAAKGGAPRGVRQRPSIKRLKNFLKTLEENAPRDDYEKGVIDTLRYAVLGQISSDSRWAAYTGVGSRHGHPRSPDDERRHPTRGHDPVDPDARSGPRAGLARP